MAIFSKKSRPLAHNLTSTNIDALLAAGTEIPFTTPALSKEKRRNETWQKEAWAYLDLVPEFHFGVHLKAQVASQVKVHVDKLAADPTEEPKRSTNKDANNTLYRLTGGSAYLSDILYEGVVCLSVPGEFYLIGLAGNPVTSPPTPERWGIYTSEELDINPSLRTVTIKEDATFGQAKRVLTPRDYFGRIHNPHPRNSNYADSPAKAILSTCETLLKLENALHAAADSRLTAGILKLASELEPPIEAPTGEQATPDKPKESLQAKLMKLMSLSMANPKSAAARVPIMVSGPFDVIDRGVSHITLDRPFDQQIDSFIERCLKRIANGLDLPPEIILGLAEASHWTSYALEETFITQHILPIVNRVLDSITKMWFQPTLEKLGVSDHTRYVIVADASDLIIHPTETSDSLAAHEAGAISDAALRSKLHFDDNDAPTDQELLTRMAYRRGAIDPAMEAAILKARFGINLPTATSTSHQLGAGGVNGDRTVTPTDLRPNTVRTNQAVPDARPSGSGAIRASASPHDDLSAKIQGATSVAILNAIEKAGTRIRSKAQKDKLISATISSVPNGDVAPTLGKAVVAGLGLDTDALLANAFVGLNQILTSYSIPQPAIATYISALEPLTATCMYQSAANRHLPTPDPTPLVAALSSPSPDGTH